MTLRKACLVVGVGLFIGLMISLNNSFAASNSQPPITNYRKLSIAPNSTIEVVKKGSVNQGAFDVSNLGTMGYSFNVYAEPYSVIGENYSPNFSPIPGTPNVANWFRFSPTNSYVMPNQTVTINYTLKIPKNVVSGGYYAVALAETSLGQTGSGIAVNERVGDIFYLTVAGPAKMSGSIKNLSVKFFQKPPLNAYLQIENNGSVHYFSKIVVNIGGVIGSPKYTFSSDKVILPQTIRKFNISWAKSPGFGLLKFSGTATILGKSQKLPTKYVLVLSQTARIVGIIIVLALLIAPTVIYIFKRLLRKRRRSHYKI